MKLKNVLFIGLGSIGQRHLRNLLKIQKRLNIYAFRKKKICPLLDKNNKKNDICRVYQTCFILKTVR